MTARRWSTARWAPLGLVLVGLAGCSRDEAPTNVDAPPVVTAIEAAPAEVVAAPPEPQKSPAPVDDFVERALRASGHAEVESWLSQAAELRLQALVTIVKPGAKGPADLEEHGFRLDAEYVYPASAIKTLISIAALRYLDELAKEHGVPLPPNVRMMRCKEAAGHCEVPEADEDDDPDDDVDEEKPNISREIRKLLAWSDNDSYDRLYDLVGHQRLNEMMAELGLASVRFHHRMSSGWQPQKTRRVRVYPWQGKVITLPARTSELTLAPTAVKGLSVGTAHKTAKGLVEEPMSFAEKNYASLRDLHRAQIALVRPELADLALGLDDDRRKVIVEAMTGRVVAGKQGAVHKPMVNGVLEVLAAGRVRYVNKSGRAYGFHLENAYVEDRESDRAFFVTVVVYANPNGVLNDDDYAYEELSQPVLAAVGAGLSRLVFEPAP
jgi:hypothetical protein